MSDAEIKPPEQLINDRESYELSMSDLDRVTDGASNTQADLKAFVEEQQAQAKGMIDSRFAQIGSLSPKNAKIANDIHNEVDIKIDQVVAETLRDLRVETVQVCASKLSDIVGFKLEVDILGHDQFGLDKRYTDRTVREERGFAGYEDENMTQSRDYLEGEVSASIQAETFKNEKKANPKEVSDVMKKMKTFGEVKYEEFEKEGPVLVIVPEFHYDAGIIKNNFEMISSIKDHMDFLASEGFRGEVTEDGIGTKGVTGESEVLSEIAARKVAISSAAVEDVFGAKIRTVGVDDMGLVAIAQGRLTAQSISRSFSLDNSSEKNTVESKFDFHGKTKGEVLKQSQSALLKIGELGEIIVNYRNSIWLSNIRDEMRYSKNLKKKSSNIVFLVCGAAHEQNLGVQAREMGFGGIVHFMPNAFNEPFDLETAKAYAKNQFNRE